MRINLRFRITAIFIGLALGPLLVAGAILAQRSYADERKQALELQQQVAHRASAEISGFFQELQNDIRLLSREMQAQGQADRAQQVSLILSALNSGPYRDVYREFALLDENGQETLRLSRQEITPPDQLQNRAGTPEFEQAKSKDATFFSPIWFDEATGESLVTIAIPISDIRSVRVSNVLVVDARVDTIGNLIARMDLGANQTVYVVDGDNRVIAHQNSEIVSQELFFELPEQSGTYTGLSGEAAVLGLDKVQLGEQVFTVVAEKPESIALIAATNTVSTVVLVIVVVLAVASLLSVLAARYFVLPIERLSSVAHQIQSGDFSQKAMVGRSDEIGDLALAFNAMTDDLQGLIASERESKAYLESALADYTDFIEQVARGDLTARLELDNIADQPGMGNDLSDLGGNLNVMVESLRDMTTQVRDVASAVARAVAEIQAAISQQYATATEQDVAITQTMSTVEEVRVTVEQTAQRAGQVAESSRQSVAVSQQGQAVVLDTITGMETVQDRVASIAETILTLSERTQQIGEIIDTVNALADQSKLLALNASIEAARAGEEGKGFAVVAMEVRQLAEQSREATARVQDILHDIQQATNTAVMVTEEGSKGAAAGMGLVEAAGDAIRELAATLEGAMQAATQIAASTQQQTNGMEQLAAAMTQIQASSTQAAASAEQTEQSARNIVEMAHQLEDAAARYQV